jgi:dTDP-4-dehydrorhamnose reductase
VRILLTGANGQVGWELRRSLAPLGNLDAFGRAALDLEKSDEIRARVRELRPDVIVNAGAYTAVDKAESEPELAFAVNARAPEILAEETKRLGALLIHYSTDYVFDGTKPGPYVETDTPNPFSVYGKSKLAGEDAIQATGCRHVILRTSWVYASRGKNFLLTILRLAKERPELRVVDDQHGAPTWARDIADASAKILCRGEAPNGLYHLTAAGETTWCGFARAILQVAGLETPVHAITTAEYPTPARRPMNSILESTKTRTTFGIAMRNWREATDVCVTEYHKQL